MELPTTNLEPIIAAGPLLVLFGATLSFVLFSAILFYHERKYSIRRTTTLTLFNVFLFGGVLLLTAALVAYTALP